MCLNYTQWMSALTHHALLFSLDIPHEASSSPTCCSAYTSPACRISSSAGSSTGTVCNVTWTKPRHLNTVIRARAGYWLNYTWKQGHLKEARALNIMINYSLIREDKSQLNKNNTGLHAAQEGSVFNARLHFYTWKTTYVKGIYLNIWHNTSRSI